MIHISEAVAYFKYEHVGSQLYTLKLTRELCSLTTIN